MNAKQTESLIASVHQAEIDQARDVMRKAIVEAQDAWISSPAIGDALLLEFIALAGKDLSADQLAKHLNKLASQLTAASTKAH